MDQRLLFEAITEGMAGEPALRGLFLAGSYGRGTADEFSDVDLVALADADHRSGLAGKFRAVLQGIAPIVFWKTLGQDRILINTVTEDWRRCDLHIIGPLDFVGRSRDTVKPLIDRDGVFDTLPATLPPRNADPERVEYLINEFIRVLGLLPVVVGRKEYFTAVEGVGLQRGHLAGLMLEERPGKNLGGHLHLSRILSAEQMDVLLALPCPAPTRDAVIDAHLMIARAFFPRARSLATQLEIDWPADFEAATRRVLEKHFGTGRDVSW